MSSLWPETGGRGRLLRNLRTLLALGSTSSSVTDLEAGDTQARALSRRIADAIPLSHATGRAAFLGVVESGAIYSYSRLVERRMRRSRTSGDPCVEKILGTEDSVFSFAAPFRYPETSCGIVFKIELERDNRGRSVATPFDSGGTIQHLRPDDSTADQIAFLRAHELPVPEYREVLAVLLDSCFASPWDYVVGREPLQAWPIAVEGGDWRRWTFEVRFRDRIRLSNTVLAVFLPVAVASEQRVLRQIARWRAAGVVVKFFRTPRTGDWRVLQRLSTEYFESYLSRNDD